MFGRGSQALYIYPEYMLSPSTAMSCRSCCLMYYRILSMNEGRVVVHCLAKQGIPATQTAKSRPNFPQIMPASLDVSFETRYLSVFA